MTVIAILGPTASGKSSLALRVAQRIRGEIVNTDSMQVYRGMDIGTAKPDPAERALVPHHMFDVWPISHSVSVAEFQSSARACIDDVMARGSVPVIVGGSGLYVSAVLDDMSFPGTDPAVRDRLEHELEALGPAALHARLAALDPVAAEAILVSNGRRIVRALEVIEVTGQPFIARLPDPVDVYPTIRVGLSIGRQDLDARIERRVGAMWEAGFVDEVRRLRRQLRTGRTSSRALGYQQILAFLAGECTEEQARQDTIDATRRFARRQQRWFARDPRIVWMDYDAADAADRVLGLLGPVTST